MRYSLLFFLWVVLFVQIFLIKANGQRVVGEKKVWRVKNVKIIDSALADQLYSILDSIRKKRLECEEINEKDNAWEISCSMANDDLKGVFVIREINNYHVCSSAEEIIEEGFLGAFRRNADNYLVFSDTTSCIFRRTSDSLSITYTRAPKEARDSFFPCGPSVNTVVPRWKYALSNCPPEHLKYVESIGTSGCNEND